MFQQNDLALVAREPVDQATQLDNFLSPLESAAGCRVICRKRLEPLSRLIHATLDPRHRQFQSAVVVVDGIVDRIDEVCVAVLAALGLEQAA